MQLIRLFFVVISVVFSIPALAHSAAEKTKFVAIDALTRESRTKLLEIGINIEEVYSDRVWSLVDEEEIKRAKENGFKILSETSSESFYRTRASLFNKNPNKKSRPPKKTATIKLAPITINV